VFLSLSLFYQIEKIEKASLKKQVQELEVLVPKKKKKKKKKKEGEEEEGADDDNTGQDDKEGAPEGAPAAPEEAASAPEAGGKGDEASAPAEEGEAGVVDDPYETRLGEIVEERLKIESNPDSLLKNDQIAKLDEEESRVIKERDTPKDMPGVRSGPKPPPVEEEAPEAIDAKAVRISELERELEKMKRVWVMDKQSLLASDKEEWRPATITDIVEKGTALIETAEGKEEAVPASELLVRTEKLDSDNLADMSTLEEKSDKI